MVDPASFFFIVGCQRSGTTMLRLILDCHPEIVCFDEDKAYAALASGQFDVPVGRRLVGFKIPRWTETLLEPFCWDVMQEESARGIYQGQPILFMLRDVRDTVASMLKLKFGGIITWLEACARPILQGKTTDCQSTLAQQLANDLRRVRASGDAPHLVGALYWKYKTMMYFKLREIGVPVYPVRYEMLTRYPRHQLAGVLAFLGVRWDEAVLDHHNRSSENLQITGQPAGNTDPKRSIDARGIGQYPQFLTTQQVQEVMQLAGALNRRVRVECSAGSSMNRLARRVWIALAG